MAVAYFDSIYENFKVVKRVEIEKEIKPDIANPKLYSMKLGNFERESDFDIEAGRDLFFLKVKIGANSGYNVLVINPKGTTLGFFPHFILPRNSIKDFQIIQIYQSSSYITKQSIALVFTSQDRKGNGGTLLQLIEPNEPEISRNLFQISKLSHKSIAFFNTDLVEEKVKNLRFLNILSQERALEDYNLYSDIQITYTSFVPSQKFEINENLKKNDTYSIDIDELPAQEEDEYKVIYKANPYLMVEGNLIDVKVTLDSKFDEHWKKMIINPIYSLESRAYF